MHQRFGYRRLFELLRREGDSFGIIPIYRLYCEEGLAERKRNALSKTVSKRVPVIVEVQPNAHWVLDFIHNQFSGGQRFQGLSVVDGVTRGWLAVIPGNSISGLHVAPEMMALIKRHRNIVMIVRDRAFDAP